MYQATSIQRALHAAFPVVGIGAAAGGMDALHAFFAAMPPTNGMAFVVLVQPHAQDVRIVAEQLQQVTTMPVQALTGAAQLVAETVYIIPPNHFLYIHDHLLDAVALTAEVAHNAHGALDRLFRALAEVYTRYTVGIILSGEGADGAVGVAQIKELGGIIIAQDPHEAEYSAMPQHVINTGVSDFVLPVAAMPDHLLTLWKHEKHITVAAELYAPSIDESQSIQDTLRTILATVHDRTGYDFTHYQRQAVLRRIERRILVTLQPDLLAYAAYVQRHAPEAHLLRDDLLVSVTCFFRNHTAYNALERTVVPLLFAGKTAGDTVRVWVAGCASGEEAYSLAILLLEYATMLPDPPAIQLFASDVNEAVLQMARDGCYPESIAVDVPPERLRQFFRREKTGYRVIAPVRDIVMFAQHNVLVDTPFAQLDLISCRNVLSYMDQAAQERVAHSFQCALRPGGFLFLGNAELVDALHNRFLTADMPSKLFRTKAVTAIRRTTPVKPSHEPSTQAQTPLASPSLPAESMAFDRVHMQLLEHYQSASVVVNAAYELVQLSKHADRFIQVGDGVHSFNIFTMARPELRDDLRLALLQAAQTNQSVESQRIRLEYGDYSEFVSMRVYPERDPSTQVWFALILFDVVERILGVQSAQEHAAEARIHKLEADLLHLYDDLRVINDDLTNLIESAHSAVLFLDRNLKVTRFTPQATNIFSLINTDESRPLSHIPHRLDYADLLTDAQSVLGTAQPIEREIGSHDGQAFLVRIAPYHTAQHWNAGVVLRFVDITDRKQAEADLAQAYAAEKAARVTVERALQTRDQFLSIASHELRTPMTALLGYAQMLRRSLQNGKGDTTKMADRVIRQTHRIDSLVDQLLDVSRLQRGQFALERRPIDLNTLGAQIVAEFCETLPDAAAQAVSFVPDDSSAPVMVHADPARIEQVMLNLLSNAVKYSPPCGIVQMRLHQTATEAVLEVADQGIGVPEQVQRQIFQPFFRAENIDVQVSGFGLGLYIVQNIIERHEGSIMIKSNEGVGSTFRISLPLLTAEETAQPDNKTAHPQE